MVTVLFGRIGAWVGGALVVFLVLALVGGRITARRLEGQIAKLEQASANTRADLAQCRTGKADLEGTIKRQNAAVADLKRESDVRAAGAEKAAQQARRARDGAVKSITGMLNAKAPAGVDQCAAADAFILTWAGVK